MSERRILWKPTEEQASATTMAAFQRFVAQRGQSFDDYQAMWEWSVSDLDGFWAAVWDYFDLGPRGDVILAKDQMPGAEWFPGTEVNFAANILKHADSQGDKPALILQSEAFGERVTSWRDLRAQVASVAAHLRGMGVAKGDRVVAVLPNAEAAIIACLATTSLGAIWSLCAPDMGHVAIIDRFRQIEPKVLIAQDGYVHRGKMVDRREALTSIVAELPSLAHRVWLPVAGALPEGAVAWDSLTGDDAPFEPVPVPFDHPLWVVYSSGTTGNPKPIVHGHGGIMVEAAKQTLHQNLTAEDRFCWITSSGWIMWNSQFTPLSMGGTVALFDGAADHPDLGAIWRFAGAQKLTYLGLGAALVPVCIKAGIRPREIANLSNLKGLGVTGSPLTEDGYEWIYDAVSPDVWLAPISGGTDLAGAFVGGNPMLPVRSGEMQCRFLGNAVRAFDEAGNEVIDQVGELVCTRPLPSMPLCFWGDDDGTRLFESYFDTYPGIWRHGDWIEITAEGGSLIYGRSDATINRRGLRLGSSEIYKAVEALEGVQDSLVVDLEFLGRESFMVLFVVPRQGALSDALQEQIRGAIRATVSPRFVPNEMVEIAEVPRTLSGKKLEVPVKKLLLGHAPDKVVNRDSMANPDSFDAFVAYAAKHEESRKSG